MDQPLPQSRSRMPKALAVMTGIVALVVAIAWFVYEYSDVLWPDQAYKSAWYLGSEGTLFMLENGALVPVPNVPSGVHDAARAAGSYALIIAEGNTASVYLNENRIATSALYRDVALSPDGTQVAYARSSEGGTAPSAWEIVHVAGDTSVLQTNKRFSNNVADSEEINASHSRESVAFCSLDKYTMSR